MGEIEYGKCDVCGNKANLKRKYFRYDFSCNCCSGKHFELVKYCKNCTPTPPRQTLVTVTPTNVGSENLNSRCSLHNVGTCPYEHKDSGGCSFDGICTNRTSIIKLKNTSIQISELGKEGKFVSGTKHWQLTWAQYKNSRFYVDTKVRYVDTDDSEEHIGEIEYIIVTERGDVDVSIANTTLGRVDLDAVTKI